MIPLEQILGVLWFIAMLLVVFDKMLNRNGKLVVGGLITACFLAVWLTSKG